MERAEGVRRREEVVASEATSFHRLEMVIRLSMVGTRFEG